MSGKKKEFQFDLKKFTALEEKDKPTYIIEAIQSFESLKNVKKISSKNKIQMIKDLLTEISLSYQLLTNCIDEVVSIIPSMFQIVGDIPNADDYVYFYNSICSYVVGVPEFCQKLLPLTDVLFSNNSFCKSFVDNHCLESLIMKFTETGQINIFFNLIPHIKSELFLTYFTTKQSAGEIYRILNYICISSLDPKSIYFILSFTFQLIPNIFRNENGIINLLLDEKIFDKINKILMNFTAKEILDIYGYLLPCTIDSVQIPMNPIIIRELCKIYQSVNNDIKNGIINFFAYQNNIFSNEFCINDSLFSLESWFCNSVCEDIELFKKYSILIMNCYKVFPDSITSSIHKIVDYISPLFKENVLYSEIFKWMNDFLEKNAVSNLVFDDEYFIEKIIIENPLDNVYECTKKFDSFHDLFSLLFSTKRTKWHKANNLKRIIELIMLDNELKDFFVDLIRNNYTPGMLRYFFDNFLDIEIRNIFMETFSFNSFKRIQDIIVSDIFCPIEKNIDKIEEFYEPLLTFIVKVNTHFHDYFFDKWVLELPKDSPLFSLSGEKIKEFVFPKNPFLPIQIPSLLCLCEPFQTKDPLNLYLISNYSIPILLKLDLPLNKIPPLPIAISRYLSPKYLDIMTQSYIDCALLVDKLDTDDNFNFYEFLPVGIPSYIIIKQKLNSSFSFQVKFIQPFVNEYTFLYFNKKQFIIWKDQIIVDDKSKKIQFNKWIQIILTCEKGKFSITIDHELLYSFNVPEQTLLDIESFGSKNQLPELPFYIAETMKTFNYKNNEIVNSVNVEYYTNGVILIKYFFVTSIYEDFNQLSIVFARFEEETNPTKYEKFIFYICKIINFVNVKNIEKAISYLIYLIKQKISYVKVTWINSVFDCIVNIKNVKKRSSLFKNFFYDVELWSSIEPTILYNFIKNLNYTLSKKADLIQFEYLYKTGIIRFLFYLVSFFDYKPLLESLESFLFLLISYIKNSQIYSSLTEIVHMTNMWTFSITKNKIGNLFLSFNNESSVQDLFTRLIFESENIGNLTLLNFDSLLYLSFVLPKETGFKCFMRVLNSYNDSKYLSIVCNTSKRYSNVEELHNFVNKNIEDKNKLELFIPILLTIDIAYWNNSDSSSFKLRTDSEILNPKILLNPNIYPYFLEFLQTENVHLPTVSVDQNLYKYIPINFSQNIFGEIELEYPKFINKLSEYLSNYTIHPPYSSDFIQFFGSFVTNIIFMAIKDSSFIKDFLYTMISHANIYLQIAVFTKCFNRFTIHRIYVKGVEIFINTLLITSLQNSKIIQDLNLFKSLLSCAESYKILYKEFMNLFIFILDEITNDEIDILIDYMLNNFKTSKKPNTQNLQYLIYHFLKRKIPTEFPKSLELYTLFLTTIRNKWSFRKVDIKEFLNLSYESQIKTVDFGEYLVYLESLFTANKRIYSIKLIDKLNQSLKTIHSEDKSEEFIKFLYSRAAYSSYLCDTMLNDFYSNMNQYLIIQEYQITKFHQIQLKCKSQITKELKTKSYKISPFALPSVCSTIIIPSPFKIYAPNEIQPEPVIVNSAKYFGMLPSNQFKVPSEFPKYIFKYSTLFDMDNKSIITKLFNFRYPNIENPLNCKLVYAFSTVHCVLFKQKDKKDFYLFLNAKYENDQINLLDFHYDTKIAIFESILLNEFGKYSLFCGHFIVKLSKKNFLMVKKHIYSAIPTAIIFSSITQGTFIIVFEENPVFECFSSPLAHVDLKESKESWLNCRMSNLDYINVLNFHANRSFTDPSAYPISPCVLRDLTGDHFELGNNIRPLDTPVDIVGDKDPKHEQFKARFRNQKFHHAENISNSMNVSLTFCRFEPYCRFQWKVNDGWDKGERNFFSFPKSITIRPTTHYELTPEFFCFPEIFLNLNKFVLPGGDSFDIVIPKWSPNIFRFIEQHRHALESLEVRRNIHSWFDITFGYKLSGPAAEEALNVFNPLSYVSMDATESEISQKHKWAKACGTVPCQLFNEPHSPSIERGKFDPLNFVYTLNSDVYTETVNIPKEILQNSIHESFSQRKAFCVVTYDNYKSTIYKITEERQFVSQITMFRNEAKFSYISEKQLMCVTVCTNEIIIWSISNGFITNIIPIKKVNALKIDEDINSMFIGVGKKMLQYTLNGFLVREIEFDDEITAITCFGTGFSIFDKYAIVGHRNGKIRICSICFDTGEFMVIQEKKLSQCSIQNIKVDISLCEVSVYDWEFVLK